MRLRELEPGDKYKLEGTDDVLVYHGRSGTYGMSTLDPDTWAVAKREGTELYIPLVTMVYKVE